VPPRVVAKEPVVSEPPVSRPAADRNLLFGVLALRMEFVGKDDLLAAMQAWAHDRTRPLGDVLVARGGLSRDRCGLLNALVEEHLKGASGGSSPQASAEATLAEGHATTPPGEGPVSGPEPGQRYRVLRPHARGGLGELFVAEDLELHREVALKEIQERFAADPESRLRFLLEGEITGRLEHPGIVPVYGLGTHADGRPFYAMRLVQGETLQDAIRRFHESRPAERGLELRRLLARFVAVCNAVAYAHSRGVIHRDLKPANIMLGKFGETVVLDWGLAKVVGRAEAARSAAEDTLHPSAGDSMATRVGSTLGTAAFMSPEQAAGRIDVQGPASDVYSLGATLYTLLTGRPPFEGGDLKTILRRVEAGEWRPPREVSRDVPAALDAVCRKAMALRPEDRYAGALDLGAEVERWLADEPVTAWREPLRLRLARWARRRPLTASWLAVSAVAYLITAAATGAFFLLAGEEVGSAQAFVLVPVFMVCVAAISMSVGAQATAALGAGGGYCLGLLTAAPGGRARRAASWAGRAGRFGLTAGSFLGYLACWGVIFWGTNWSFGSGAVPLLVIALLGPVLGAAVGLVVGGFRSARVQGAVAGGMIGAVVSMTTGFVILVNLGRFTQASPDVEMARDYTSLGRSQLRLGRHVDAARTAEELLEESSHSPLNTYNAACLLAGCAGEARTDGRLTPAEQERVSDEYGRRAVGLLRESCRGGFATVAIINGDPDLRPLRDRPDYQELMAELRGN
jgi:hypothetical protein